ncbi:MAG TPA: hypothetical protein DIC60_03905 [Lachnospiraceae bacterium]|nr:hypothetical protein [Lachnospiraceae bacterium]
MRPSSIRYYFKEGFTGLLKNRLMAVASIATVAACIFIISLSCCIIGNLSSVLKQIEDTIGIAVFLDDNLDSEKINTISDELKAIPHVTMVTYISPEEALDSLKEEWQADDILDGFDGENNPLSHSFEVSLEGIEYQSDVLKGIEGISGIRNVRHAQSETQILLKLNKVLSIVGIAIVAILSIISVVIIMNTIKISVYTRRTEINIMKFVGATDWFIRWPFIIEGVLIGLLGASIPMAVSWPLYTKIVELIYQYFPVIKGIATLLDGYVIFSKLIPVSLIFGVLLGVFGSVSSIHKHLRV